MVYRRGEHEVLWPHNRHGVLIHRRPTTIYEVDLGLHQSTIAANLPSRDESCAFRARISVQWRVLDPSAVVRHRISDVAETLAPHLLRRVRGIARAHDITQAALAEDEINIRLGSQHVDITDPAMLRQATREAVERDYPGAEYGLWTRIIAQLSLDEAAAEHAANMTRLTRAIEEEKAEQELRLLQELHQQRITADRIGVYRDIIAAGDIDRFALQLAENPGDIAAIDTIIRDELLASRRDTIDFVARMVDSGVVERWETATRPAKHSGGSRKHHLALSTNSTTASPSTLATASAGAAAAKSSRCTPRYPRKTPTTTLLAMAAHRAPMQPDAEETPGRRPTVIWAACASQSTPGRLDLPTAICWSPRSAS